MIAYAALDERARQLRAWHFRCRGREADHPGPGISRINGQFDPSLFLQRIRDIGFTEQRFVLEQRETRCAARLADAITADVAPPKTAAEASIIIRDEERSIDYVDPRRQQGRRNPAPTPEQLSTYFEAQRWHSGRRNIAKSC